MAKRKEIKWRWEARGTMIGRQNGIIFRIYHPWDMPEREHTVSCYDTKGSARTISTAGYRKFTWEEAVEFCQAIAAGEIDLEDLRAEFAAIEAERERQALRKAVEEAKEFRGHLEAAGISYNTLLELEALRGNLGSLGHNALLGFERGEALAIRWHMGAYDDAAKTDSRAMSAAMAASPWVWRLQEADMCAAWIDEREAGQ